MQYRPEIDGLRAISVSVVVLYHAGYSAFDGGFIGVDIFFVISGFLITSIIAHELAEGRFSIARFYDRRIRRILPALFTVILVTLPFAWMWMLPWQFKEFAQSIVSTILFVSNIFFWQTADYFAVGAAEKPLLHTWSLAVEEQYYIFFPLAMMALWRFGLRWIVGLMAVVLLASLALAELARDTYADASFYLLPTRAWELLAGAICALLPQIRRSALTEALALASLVGLIACIGLFSHATPVPSIWIAPAIVAICGILVFARDGTVTARLLSWRPFVGLGLVSYSFYLWHQPVFALARLRFSEAEADYAIALQIALSLGLAVLSYYLVEQPFRKPAKAGGLSVRAVLWPMGTLAATLSVIGVASVVMINQGYHKFQPIPRSDAMINVPEERARTWNTYVRNKKLAEEFNTFADVPHKVLIVGDSHAKDMFNAFHGNADRFPDVSFRFAFFRDGCMTSQGGDVADATANCVAAFLDRTKALSQDATHVLFSLRWAKLDQADLAPIITSAFDAVRARGLTPLLAANTVEFRPTTQFVIAQLYRQDALNPARAAQALYTRRDPAILAVNTTLQDLAAKHALPLLQKSSLQCGADETCTAITPDGHAVYTDSNHFTIEGAQYFGAKAAETGWLRTALQAE